MEQAHCSALAAKHAGLDHRIAEEARRPSPDPAVIAQLKKKKLMIKDALATH